MIGDLGGPGMRRLIDGLAALVPVSFQLEHAAKTCRNSTDSYPERFRLLDDSERNPMMQEGDGAKTPKPPLPPPLSANRRKSRFIRGTLIIVGRRLPSWLRRTGPSPVVGFMPDGKLVGTIEAGSDAPKTRESLLATLLYGKD